MSSYLPWCFRACLDCVQGPSFAEATYYKRMKNEPAVKLDVNKTGSDVIILKEGERICGTGSALCTAPLVQNKSYWQVDIQQTGSWCVGLATTECGLSEAPPRKGFWGMNEKGELISNGEVVGKTEKIVEEGDSIGLTYDHLELKFYVNGDPLTDVVTNVRGKVFPAVFVDESAILDARFSDFSKPPPKDFSEILLEQTIL
ncbi:unnamed protein product, partial [Mesorhabditis belari]|uniref:SPRY domain-containing protein 7 n=1 Tax=Mesorhabditis belari TaxID=2138241 RepID=A0AAF3FN94_9BILA